MAVSNPTFLMPPAEGFHEFTTCRPWRAVGGCHFAAGGAHLPPLAVPRMRGDGPTSGSPNISHSPGERGNFCEWKSPLCSQGSQKDQDNYESDMRYVVSFSFDLISSEYKIRSLRISNQRFMEIASAIANIFKNQIQLAIFSVFFWKPQVAESE